MHMTHAINRVFSVIFQSIDLQRLSLLTVDFLCIETYKFVLLIFKLYFTPLNTKFNFHIQNLVKFPVFPITPITVKTLNKNLTSINFRSLVNP